MQSKKKYMLHEPSFGQTKRMNKTDEIVQFSKAQINVKKNRLTTCPLIPKGLL